MDFSFLNKQSNKKLSEEEIALVWEGFMQDKTNKELRDKIIVQYINLVKYVVNRLRSNLPSTLATEDLASYGVEGLMNAVERFSPVKGARFETYALFRIRGAILDKVRSQDWVPRTTRKRYKDIQAVISRLKVSLGREPNIDEITAQMDVSKEKIQKTLNDISKSSVVSLYAKKGNSTEGVTVLDTLEDKKNMDPAVKMEEKDVKRELSQALKKLPERERTLLTLYYHENMTLKEIGEALSVSESRVCQLHAQAIMKLKATLTASKQKVK